MNYKKYFTDGWAELDDLRSVPSMNLRTRQLIVAVPVFFLLFVWIGIFLEIPNDSARLSSLSTLIKSSLSSHLWNFITTVNIMLFGIGMMDYRFAPLRSYLKLGLCKSAFWGAAIFGFASGGVAYWGIIGVDSNFSVKVFIFLPPIIAIFTAMLLLLIFLAGVLQESEDEVTYIDKWWKVNPLFRLVAGAWVALVPIYGIVSSYA